MRTLILSILVLIFISTGCAGSGSSSRTEIGACTGIGQLGTWYNNISGDYITLNDSCTGSATRCTHLFSYTKPDAAGNTIIQITQSNNAGGCMTVGLQTCTAVNSNPNTLQLNCGFGVMTYTK
jgi:hypothetical protein